MQGLELLRHLYGELPGGTEHYGLRRTVRFAGLYDWDPESSGFSGARPGLSYDVHSLSCEWYGLKLYLRRLFPAKSANGISHVLLEVPVIE